MGPRSGGRVLVAHRVVSTVLLAAIGASACSRGKAMPSAKPSSGESANAGSDIRHQRPPPGKLYVLVVDESGKPIAGASVTGDYRQDSTPMPSSCCYEESLGEQTTGRDGVAVLDAPPRTFLAYKITATRAGWPPGGVSLGRYGGNPQMDAWGRIVISLGPPREIRGRVDTGADCPPGFVQVTGGMPPVSALVDGAGQFVLRGLSPSAVSIGFSACGRNAGVRVEPRASSPIVLALPPRKPGNWSFDVPSSSSPRATAAAPATRLSCLQPSGDLLAAGDFDSMVLDEQCRFMLAGKRISDSRYGARNWTLVRPDGTKVPIGASAWGVPQIGENVVYLSVPGDETRAEIVDFVRGTRELLPPANFVPAAHDATVLARPAITGAGSQAHELEVRWYDGTRRKLRGPVDASSLVRNNRSLFYGVVPGKRSAHDVHLLDLETRIDRVIATNVLQALGIDDGRALLIRENDQTIIYDIERNKRDVLRGSGSEWHVFGRDLALKTERDGSAWLRKSNATLPLPFRWPHDAHAHSLTEHYLFFGAESHAVLVDTTNGVPRALASGVTVSEDTPPPMSGDSVALSETSGRVLVASLSGGPMRAVGRGVPRVFSPDGRWLMIVREMEREITLAPVTGSEQPVTVSGWAGRFAPDLPALFIHGGNGASPDQPVPLYATYPALGRTLEIEPRVVDYAVLRGGEVLAVVPPGGARAPGIYRRVVPH